MRTRRVVKEAWTNLNAARQRSVLALLGITVGIGSVIAMVSIGASARAEAEAQFRALGTDLFAITLATETGNGRPRARIEALSGLAAETGAVATVAAVAQLGAFPSFRGKNLKDVQVLAVQESFFDVSRARAEQGRLLTSLDAGRRFCVIGSNVAALFAERGAPAAVGRAVTVGDRVYTVIGVLGKTPRSRLTSYVIDDTVLVPIEIATRAAREDVGFAIGRLDPRLDFREAVARIGRYLAAKHLDGSVETTEELVQQMERQARLFSLLLGAIGAISLIVGGVGVMNVMLASVTERKREIGLLRALGARRATVQALFLAESLLLGVIGGGCGVLTGFTAAAIVCRVSGWPFHPSLAGTVAGVAMAAAIAVFFGSFPARQAARIHPMLVLR